RDRQQACPGAAPAVQVLAGPRDGPLPDRHDEPGFLEYGHELRRRQHAALGMLPAQQRLGAARAARPQFDLGLVHEAELVALERALKLQGEVSAGAAAARGVELREGIELALAVDALQGGGKETRQRIEERQDRERTR